MNRLVVTFIAVAGFGTARFARTAAQAESVEGGADEVYSPSPGAAPFVSLGYRELAADVLFVRLRGYFGGDHNTADGIASLVEAIVALDPQFHRAYDYGARAMELATTGVDNAIYLRAIGVLDTGMKVFRDDWRLPDLASEIYTQDLQTDDPAKRREWDEKGTLLAESSVRKPGAPQEAATWAATMRTRLGQHERAAAGLKEMLLVTNDPTTRARLIDKLAALDHADAAEIAGEIYEQRRKFEQAWRADRPTLPATMYILLGAHPQPGFDLGDLATGGRDVTGTDEVEKLPPVD